MTIHRVCEICHVDLISDPFHNLCKDDPDYELLGEEVTYDDGSTIHVCKKCWKTTLDELPEEE